MVVGGADIALILPNATQYSLKLDTSAAGGLQGALTRQDVTPSNVAFKANLPGWEEMQPFSERTYEWLGSLGLLEQTDAPGDNNRWWIGDLDTRRTRQIHAPLRKNGGTVSATTQTPTARPFFAIDASAAPGFSTNYASGQGYWQWNGTSYGFSRRVQTTNTNLLGGVTYVSRAPLSNQNGLQATEYDGKLWLAASGAQGMFDANTAYPQTVNVGGTTGMACIGHQLLGDTIFVFSWTDATRVQPGITITAFDNTMAKITRDAELGAANISQAVKNVVHLHGACACDTSLYFTSDRQFYQMVYDESYQRILVSSLLQNAEGPITSAPVNFNGLVYFGAGARVAQYTPGDRKPTYLPISDMNTVPAPFNGHVTNLLATTDGLYASVVALDGTQTWAMLRMDANSVWSIIYTDLTPTYSAALSALVRTSDATTSNPINVCAGYSQTSSSGVFKVVPLPDVSQNPVYMTSTYRQQESGSHYLIQAYECGESRGSPKYALRVPIEVADVTASLPIKVWYQIDTDEYKANNFIVNGVSSGVGAGLIPTGRGQWTRLGVLDNTTSGLTTVDGTAYSGFAVLKFDTLLYPGFKAIRLMYEIPGDTTGTYLPRIRGAKLRYLEVPAKYYLWTASIRIRQRDKQFGDTLAAQNATDVYTQYSNLLALSQAGTIVTLVDPNGGSRKVQLTKCVESWRLKDNAGGDAAAQPAAGVRQMKDFRLTISMEEIEDAAA